MLCPCYCYQICESIVHNEIQEWWPIIVQNGVILCLYSYFFLLQSQSCSILPTVLKEYLYLYIAHKLTLHVCMHSKPTCYPKKVTVSLVAGIQSCTLDIHVSQSNHTNNGNVQAKKIAQIVINLDIKMCGVLFCFSRLIWLSWWVIKVISFFGERGNPCIPALSFPCCIFLLNTVYRGIYGHDCHCVIACFVWYG